MTVIEPGGTASGLIERVKNILIAPRAEWERISQERTGLGPLLMGYVLPLAVLSALCGFIGLSIIGAGAFGVSYRVPIVAGLVGAVLQVAVMLFWVWLLGLIINGLAPTFGAQQDPTRANQLAAYSPTAALVAGVFTILPALSVLTIIGGLYSLALLYMGLKRLMNAPDDKRLTYFLAIVASSIVAGLVLAVALGAVRQVVAPLGAGGFAFGGAAQQQEAQGEIRLPNGETVDVSELERAAKELEAMAANPQATASGAAVSMEQLRALLPDTLPNGLIRTSIETGSTGAMGGVANATGVYESGEVRIEIQITDMGPLGALTAMGGMMGAQSSREDADGYERTTTVDGRMTIEEMSRSQGTAKYGVIAGNRILIMAEGREAPVEWVRAAVNAVGVARVEALAQQSAAAAQ